MPSDTVIRLRHLVHTFLHRDVLPSITQGDAVLEIGPMHAGSCPVPEAFVDTKAAVLAAGGGYTSCDPDPAAGATICADFLEPTAFYGNEQFDHIVACEVFEHVPRVWDAPAVLAGLLKPGGVLWLSTPFMFEKHGPAPDCWRFTDDGLRALFGRHFFLDVWASDGHAEPLHYCARAVKR
jgi:SAM-dependent methyltransferase